MRILHITSHLNIGGVTSHVMSLAKALRSRGHTVFIASGGGWLEEQIDSMPNLIHWRVPLRTSVEFGPKAWLGTWQLSKRLRQERVDILHAHTRVGQVVAERLAKRFDIPYVTTWHGFFGSNIGRRIWPCLGARTIAISRPVVEHLIKDFNLPPRQISLIPHGVDDRFFGVESDGSARERLREKIGLAANQPVIGTVSRLVTSKGVDQLVLSLPKIREIIPDAALLIVGDGEARSQLERMAADRGVALAVHFIGRIADVRPALSLMNVFVFLPADQEGFGLSLLEAMASARPVVAVDRGGGATWVLEESHVGMRVKPGDEKALAEAVLRFLQDPAAARREAEKAREVVQQKYSLQRVAAEVETLYRDVLDNRVPVGK